MPTNPTPTLHRIEVRTQPHLHDPRAEAIQRRAAALNFPLASVATAKVYLVEAPLDEGALDRILQRLLADPITEHARLGPAPTPAGSHTIEVHPLPGVMDPAAQSVADAIRQLTGHETLVSTGARYDFSGLSADQSQSLAQQLLANPVIHQITHGPWAPSHLPTGHTYTFHLRSVPLLTLDDDALARLSREAHLFLSLEEMRAIQSEFRRVGRDPTDIELETLAQTWSEHCVHKTLKSTIRYSPSLREGLGWVDPASPSGREGAGGRVQAPPDRASTAESRAPHSPPSSPPPSAADPTNPPLTPSLREGAFRDPIDWSNRPHHTFNEDGSVTIHNLLKATVAAATFELIEDGIDWTLSVFKDNSGVVALDDHHAVCIKVETHNHPSALEPYGGAATGAGGCIRDVIGTGLGAKPIANTDVFCVAHPSGWASKQEMNAEFAENAERKTRNERGGPGQSAHSSLSSASSAPSAFNPLPPGTIHPRRILSEVVSGVRDYGNRMGIPTLNGAVAFDNRYVGNPLVFCGCVGLLPRHLIKGQARKGDRIIALGGRTGRDGIHGATFSSAELEQGHADEFSHAVQIGNAIEEKRVLDAILRARDLGTPSLREGSEFGARRSDASNINNKTPLPEGGGTRGPLFSAITDCGAGGFSSAIGEMGAELGAEVHLDRAPLKYAGLSYTEIWISEAQERMVLAVPPENRAALQQICDEEGVELADLGHFGTDNADLILRFNNTEVGRLSMHFLHEGIPTPTREATWAPPPGGRGPGGGFASAQDAPSLKSQISNSFPPSPPLSPRPLSYVLSALLSHPSIASKHWIIRQYDHEVQGNTILKPLVGPGGRGPGDAAVLEPIPGSNRGIAIGCGLQTPLGDPLIGGSDPYHMALAAIDECIRNIVCVGGDPARTAILDNFCWPSCAKPENLGALVRAAEGCYDGAKAYRTPFVSGKDSLNNQLRYTDEATGEQRVIEIPPTLLITGLAQVRNINRCTTMDAKHPGNTLILIGETQPHMAASIYAEVTGAPADADGDNPFTIPTVDLTKGPATARAVAQCIQDGLIQSAHDCSEGGLLVALAEMLIATSGLPLPDGSEGRGVGSGRTPLSGGGVGVGPFGGGGAARAQVSSSEGSSSLLSSLLYQPAALKPLGASLTLTHDLLEPHQLAFAESPSRYILEVKPADLPKVRTILRDYGGPPLTVLGLLNTSGRLTWPHADLDVDVNDLARPWLAPLDW